MTKEREYYLTKWYGSADMEEDVFARYWNEAKQHIMRNTFGRTNFETDAEMTCACAVVDCLKKYDNAASPAIAAESADGLSTTFRNGADVIKEKNAEIAELCRLYLPQELLYKGLI